MNLKNTACFELNSVVDLFCKAESDFKKFDEFINSYDLFNFLCTINHLRDWIRDEIRISLQDRDNGYKLHLIEPKINLVRELCNRAKHFSNVQTSPSTSVTTGFGSGRYGKGAFGIGEPSYFVTDDNEQQIFILDLCNDSLEIWRQFLKKTELIP